MNYRAAATFHLFHYVPLIILSAFGFGGLASGEWSFGRFLTYMACVGVCELFFQLYAPDSPAVQRVLDAESRERRDKLRKVTLQKELEEVGSFNHPGDPFRNLTHPYARATEIEGEVQTYIDGLSAEMAGILSDVMPKVRAIVRSIYRLALDYRKIDLILGRDSESSLQALIAGIQAKMVTEEGKPPVPESLMVVYKQRIALLEGRIAKRGELERRKEMIGPQLETLVETLQLVRDQVMLPMGETRVRVDVDAIVRDSIATEGSLGDVMQAVLDAEEARAELDMHEASR